MLFNKVDQLDHHLRLKIWAPKELMAHKDMDLFWGK